MIDKTYIENWARTVPAKAEFPELVLRLVQATIPSCQNKVDIPIGSSIYIGGWDGWINTKEGTTYIPQGLSGWEFGTDDSPISKANSDYKKRTEAENPVYNKAETTFVFVTPWIWTKKDEWVNEKKREGKWKDIIVYDSDSISQWLLAAPVVEKWLAPRVGAIPASGFDIVDEKWEDYIRGNKPYILTPDFYTCGREGVVNELERLFQNKQPFILGIEASTREEAIAFILAAGKTISPNERDLFKSKGVVVYDKDSFRNLMTHRLSLCFIPVIDDYGMAFSARGRNHSVIVPLSQNDEFTSNKIKLPISNKHRLVDILISFGVDKPEAERIVRDNSCNLALIRKELDFPPFRVDWQKNEDLKELLPALLLGKWSDGSKGDQAMLSLLSNTDFKEYHARLVYWSKLPISPVINIGNTWRLTSPLSLWSALSDSIKVEHLDLMSKAFDKIFIESENEYSCQLKKGILENLIIVSLYGKGMGLVENGQSWTDALVEKLLKNEDPKKWIEFSDFMPLLAEASPSVFVKYIQSIIANNKEIVLALFGEEKGLYFSESHHTHLLWALEALAWLPDYLQPVTEILLQLSEIDPGGSLANRPFNSLTSIYLFWYPQTSASLEQRLTIIENCIGKGYSHVWNLLLALLPQPNSTTMQNEQLKWRDFEFEERKAINANEINKTTEWVVEHLMAMYDGKDTDLSQLIEKMEPIFPSIRGKLIAWLPLAVENIKDNGGALTRKVLRETIWYHYLDGIKNYYSLTAEELQIIEDAYQKLTPSDLKKKHQWLFDEDFPHLAQKIEKDPDDGYANIQQLNRLRKEACEELLNEFGVEDVVAMKDVVAEPRILGTTLAQFHSIGGLTDMICSLLDNEKDSRFIMGYISSLESLVGMETFQKVYRSCESNGYTDEALTVLLLSIYPKKDLWLFVNNLKGSVQNLYWQKTQGCFFGPYRDDITYQIEKFVDAGRAVDAMNHSWIYAKELSTEVIQQLLKGVLTATKALNGSLDQLALGRYMEELHGRDDVDQDLLLQLEWAFLPALVHHSEEVCLNSIYSQLSKDPSFFVELLTYLYKPDDETVKEDDETDEKTKQANSNRAFHLFYHWDKIPYVSQEGVVDVQGLTDWVKLALSIAKEKNRITAAYIQLGGLFAHYGESGEHASDLFSVMETIDSTSFFNNYRVGLFNKRGSTVRGPYEGGEIERGNESFFKALYERYHVQFPKVAKVFKDLAAEYAVMAKQMDEEADLTKLDY